MSASSNDCAREEVAAIPWRDALSKALQRAAAANAEACVRILDAARIEERGRALGCAHENAQTTIDGLRQRSSKMLTRLLDMEIAIRDWEKAYSEYLSDDHRFFDEVEANLASAEKRLRTIVDQSESEASIGALFVAEHDALTAFLSLRGDANEAERKAAFTLRSIWREIHLRENAK